MADDRYSWLDEEAAERLLRGQPVDAPDTPATDGVERLAAALDDLTVPCPAKDELPGEAAALAAFRDARTQVLRSGGLEPRPKRTQRALRSPRFGRPLRVGLAVALAGCALGGVAVAATTGALPTPFGGDSSTRPSPTEPLHSPADDDTGSGSGHPSKSYDEDDGHSHDGDSEAEGKGESDGRSGDRAAAGPGQGPGDQPGSGPDGADAGSWKQDRSVVAKLCKSYENDDLDRGDRKRLERAAGGSGKVSSFCRQHGSGSGGSGSSGGTGDSGGSTGGSGSTGSTGGSTGSSATGGSGGSGSSGGDEGGNGGTEGGDESGDGGTEGGDEQHGGTGNGGHSGGDSTTSAPPASPEETPSPEV